MTWGIVEVRVHGSYSSPSLSQSNGTNETNKADGKDIKQVIAPFTFFQYKSQHFLDALGVSSKILGGGGSGGVAVKYV